MARRPAPDPKTVEAEIARLPDLGLAELRERWQALYGNPAPKTFRRGLLIRAVAYQMQIELYGGLSPTLQRRIRQIYQAIRSGRADELAPLRIKPGTKLIRQWQGKTYAVTVLAEGFECEGKRYRSLSEIARHITGTRWNGLVFFGVKQRQSKQPRSEGAQSR